MVNKGTLLPPCPPCQGFLTFSCLSPVSTTCREPRALASTPTTVQQVCCVGFPAAWAPAPRGAHIVLNTQKCGRWRSVNARLLPRKSLFTNLCRNLPHPSIPSFIHQIFTHVYPGKGPQECRHEQDTVPAQNLVTGADGQVKR